MLTLTSSVYWKCTARRPKQGKDDTLENPMGLFASVFSSVEERLCWRRDFSLLTQTHPRLINTPLPYSNLTQQKVTPKQHQAGKPRLLLAATGHQGSATLNPRELQQRFWLLPNIVLGETIFRNESTIEKTGYLPPVARVSTFGSHHCCMCLTQQDPDI